MRVTITTVEDFCAEIEREAAAGCVWRQQVRARIDYGAETKQEISFLVAIWGTARISTPHGDYLLEYGEECGSDDPDNEIMHKAPPDAGTRCAQAKHDMIRAACEKAGLELLPGKFEVM